MLVLFETSAGFALFKVLKEGKIEEAKDMYSDFETLDKANKVSSRAGGLRFFTTRGQHLASLHIHNPINAKGVEVSVLPHVSLIVELEGGPGTTSRGSPLPACISSDESYLRAHFVCIYAHIS